MGKFGVHGLDHTTANGTIYPLIGLVAAAGERGRFRYCYRPNSFNDMLKHTCGFKLI